jgi:hypothetical protein
MSTITSNQATDSVNNLYTQAQAFRAFAVQLEADPSNSKAALMWHHMADHLFDAVNTYDSALSSK